ncbi:transaldolase family protein [Nakamurella deserti]|uniref:transaldolase family protein n=1 Tax=Nakamurella deserti TaxID=2164074 RepID=UPI000DBE2A6F|nr:transaldolase family protein [Nakamurella deserti]
MTRLSLFIDSAQQREVEPLLATGLFDGVTTNPSLLARAGLTQDDLPAVHRWATAAGASRVYLQTLGLTLPEILASGRGLRDLGDDVVVKIPATASGFAAARRLAAEDVPVLITAVHHASQAVLAVAADAHSIAPYVGRMTDAGRDGIAQTLAMQRILGDCRTSVLAASVRTADDVALLAAGGVTDFTLSPALLEQMLQDDLTTAAAAAFEDALAGPPPPAVAPTGPADAEGGQWTGPPR